MSKFRKDPDATLDYTFDWTRWLSTGEAIVTHQIIAPSGVNVGATVADAEMVTAWISGGTNGNNYIVTCRVTTDQGRTDDRSIILQVLDK